MRGVGRRPAQQRQARCTAPESKHIGARGGRAGGGAWARTRAISSAGASRSESVVSRDAIFSSASSRSAVSSYAAEGHSCARLGTQGGRERVGERVGER
eukprot:1152974-Prymnesium_polylepis.1